MKKKVLLMLMFFTICNLIAQVFPDEHWEYDNERKGWDSSKGMQYYQYVRDSSVVTGLMIIQNGKVILEYGDVQENSYIASCRKSILSMLYGKYVENGTINLNKTIAELNIDDVDGILPLEKEATVQHLISARSGVYHPEGYPGGMQEFAPKRGSKKPEIGRAHV